MDEGNRLTYVRARYYSTELGRFITKDLLAGEDGDGQSLNRYIYAVNNPVGLVDVNGKYKQENCLNDDCNLVNKAFLKLTRELSDAPNWKVVPVKGHFRMGKWRPPSYRRAPNAVKSGAYRLGLLVGPAIQAASDWNRSDLSGFQKIGRYSISVLETAIPVIGVADLATSAVFGDEKVEEFKSNIFSNKNPIVDFLSDKIVEIGGKSFQKWSAKPSWLDFF